MSILVTGASGFVGRAIVDRLLVDGTYAVRAVVRSAKSADVGYAERCVIGDIGLATDWRNVLRGVDAIVHTAARVHVATERSVDPLQEFRRTNVIGTLQLARQAVDAGVRRFVFISSIKVNGESTPILHPYTANDPVLPVDAYAMSKSEAERALHALGVESGMEVVVVRPVLVYGPGVKANFRVMMNWLYRGIPLPFGAVNNQRSLVALDNLVDLIVRTIDHPAAANETFLVSDGRDLSTTELLKYLGAALGRQAKLYSVPSNLMRKVAALIGYGDSARRLLDSLQVDITKTKTQLDWTPRTSILEELGRTAQYFLEHDAK